jgi:hypothetical protein
VVLTVRLAAPADRPTLERAGETWAAIGCDCHLDPTRRLDPAGGLEGAFAAIVPDLLDLCRRLGGDPSAGLAHTPSAATNVSDLGEMMAWSWLVEGWAREDRSVLVVCADPWLFRHLASLAGVTAGTPPPLPGLRPAVRGFLARFRHALRAAWSAWSTRDDRNVFPGGSWLLSYGNPVSRPDGQDAYFGSLMHDEAELRRALHVDCPPAEAARLRDGGRSVSLHAWGSPLFALAALPFARWRPRAEGSWAWLVRRAAAREGATGQAAAIAWQIHCQRRWLAAVRPRAVAWPWESHGWERDLCRAARALNVRTAGYQHSTVGRFELNHHAGTLPDGPGGLPDRVLCTGALTRDVLTGWGVERDRCVVAGALRYAEATGPRHDPAAPVFFALPGDRALARCMVEAALDLARRLNRQVLVRPHPVYGVEVPEDRLVSRAACGLTGQEAVSAVVYAATTVGLEAVLFGLPTIRFVPAGCIANDILPNTLDVPAADAAGLAEAVEAAVPPRKIRREDVFAPVDPDIWRHALSLTKAAP